MKLQIVDLSGNICVSYSYRDDSALVQLKKDIQLKCTKSIETSAIFNINNETTKSINVGNCGVISTKNSATHNSIDVVKIILNTIIIISKLNFEIIIKLC